MRWRARATGGCELGPWAGLGLAPHVKGAVHSAADGHAKARLGPLELDFNQLLPCRHLDTAGKGGGWCCGQRLGQGSVASIEK